MGNKYGLFFIVALIPFSVCGACSPWLIMACDVLSLPDELPETVEELKDDCRTVTIFMNCLVDVLKNHSCGGPGHKEVVMLERISEYVAEVCQENSTEFLAISSKFDCIVSAAKTTPKVCHLSSFNDMTRGKIVYNIVGNRYLGGGEYQKCLESFFFVSCPALNIGLQCGDDVGTVLLEVLENVSLQLRMCPVEIMEEIRPIKRYIRLALEQGTDDQENEIQDRK